MISAEIDNTLAPYFTVLAVVVLASILLMWFFALGSFALMALNIVARKTPGPEEITFPVSNDYSRIALTILVGFGLHLLLVMILFAVF